MTCWSHIPFRSLGWKEFSSDELGDGQESDEDEDLKDQSVKQPNANDPANNVPIPANHADRDSAIKEDHKIILR